VPRRRRAAAAAADPTLANLRKIDHTVVLMLENRSFDHMLGYLTLVLAANQKIRAAGLPVGQP
jgi:phospholipase C